MLAGGHRGQDRARANLDEPGDTFALQPGDALVEPDGVPDVGDPVLGVGDISADDGDLGVLYVSVATTRRKSSSIGSISEEWKAWLTVSRLVFSNRAASASTTSSGPEITTRPRAVDGGDVDISRNFAWRGLDGDHRATGRKRLHQRGASPHQRARVLQEKHARHVGGGDLTH